jgi:hypothetical protein
MYSIILTLRAFLHEGRESRKYYFLVLSANKKSAIFGEQTALGIEKI